MIPPVETFDAGAVFPETTPEVVHTFKVLNPTARTVHIKQVNRSCTCTEATVSGQEIAPGATIDLIMKIKVRSDRQDLRIMSALETDDPVNPYWTYFCEFRTYPAMRFENTTLSLDAAATGVPQRATAVLEFYRPARGGASRPLPQFTLEGRPPVTVAADAAPSIVRLDGGTVELIRYPVHVAVASAHDKELPSGTETASIAARCADNSIARLNLVWTRRTPLLVAPSSVSFGIVARTDEAVSRKVVVRSEDKQPFRILSAESGSADVEAKYESVLGGGVAANHQVVDLTFRRGTPSDRFRANYLVVRTDHPNMPLLKVSWSAITP